MEMSCKILKALINAVDTTTLSIKYNSFYKEKCIQYIQFIDA